ncbi:hypothetical protein [Halobaculum gomorrense]|uniref:Uncharacterized protein n=1 Tax=Halobaculum gomorrense TaxID=43928 RepID=A0A1M5T8P9_9EURY|nr:hypothetical protein [Halobaculum gomorrense]SHH46990.1 hypothetical protein SAMN05443636_2676 [Halobaculum gomorrense]
MHRPAVPDAYIEEVAERTDFAVDDVRIGLRVLHDAVQDRIVEQYRRARDDATPNHLLTDAAEAAWFAFAFADLRSELETAGYEMDADLLAAVAAVNMTVFQELHDRTVSFPRDLAGASDTPFFYPVYVAKPDWWREAETRALRSLVGLLEAGSSPAAALDAWAVTLAGADPDEWAAVRGVDPDRVRANAASAPDPAPEAADGLRAEARDGVPDGPYDPETDRLFVPTTDQLAAAREASEGAGVGGEGTDHVEGRGVDPVDEAGAPERATDRADANTVDADASAESERASDLDPGSDPGPDRDPDRLAEIDPADLRSGDIEAADLPEYAVQGGDDDTDPPADDDTDPPADDDGRYIDGAAAFDRGDGDSRERTTDRGSGRDPDDDADDR